MGVRIVLAENEPIALALRRFKKKVEREKINWEIRRRCYFVKASEMRRAKKFKKKFKAREAMLLAKLEGKQPTTVSRTDLLETFWKRTGKP